MVDLLAELAEAESQAQQDVIADISNDDSPVGDSSDQPAEEETPTAAEQPKQKTALEKLLDDIAPVSSATKFRKIEIYGEPGTGKTALACGVGCDKSFGDGVLLVAVEPGQLTLANHPELAGVRVLPFKAVAQVIALIRTLKESPPEFDWCKVVVIDTFTTLQERDLKQITINAAMMDSTRNPNLPIGSDYQINTENMKAIARELTDLNNRHVVLTAHVKEEKDENSGKLFVRPSLTPKLSSALSGMVDMVGYLTRAVDDTGQEVRNLQVHPTEKIIAKTRIGNLPPVIINPKISDLLPL